MNRAWMEIDTDALIQNVENYRKLLPDDCKVMGVVKANAYGHGAVLCARSLEKIGVDFFAVASVAEGAELRENGISEPILVLGYTDPSVFGMLVDYDIIQTVTGPEYGSRLLDYCTENDCRIKCHAAVDTGMHRIGFMPSQIDELEALYRDKSIDMCGIFSHYCTADMGDEGSIEFSKKQAKIFESVVDKLHEDGIDPGVVHMQGSFAGMNYPKFTHDYARLGILMYGALADTTSYCTRKIKLNPVMTVKTRVASLRWIEPGESVSYGRHFTATRPTRVATLAIGYADGIFRSLSNGKLRVIIGGQYAQGLGRVCMDQIMVDVTDIKDVEIGDTAIVLGSDGKLSITAEEMAENAGTISYEIMCGFDRRLERVER